MRKLIMVLFSLSFIILLTACCGANSIFFWDGSCHKGPPTPSYYQLHPQAKYYERQRERRIVQGLDGVLYKGLN